MAVAAIVAAVATVVAAGISAYGVYEAHEAQADVAQYNKKVEQTKAQIALNQAQAARDAAAMAEAQSRDRTRRELATQRAQVGAAGIDSSGSPLAVMLDSVEAAELEAQQIRYSGELQALGHRQTAEFNVADAGLQTYYGRQAQKAGAIGTGSTLLTGASNVAGIYARYQSRTPQP
jgi:hypothetical protein